MRNLEHRHGVMGRTPALGAVRALQRRRERGAEDFEIDQFLEPRRRIADFRKFLVTLIQIEKSRPPTIAILPALRPKVNHGNAKSARFLEVSGQGRGATSEFSRMSGEYGSQFWLFARRQRDP